MAIRRLLCIQLVAVLAVGTLAGVPSAHADDNLSLVLRAEWGDEPGPGQFQNPSSVAVGPTGDVFVADSQSGDLFRFDSRGVFEDSWAVVGITAVDIDSHGMVYALSGNTVAKFTSDGDLITSWGGTGEDDGELFFPGGLAVDWVGENVYVADIAGNSSNQPGRMQRFFSDGTFVSSWGTEGGTPRGVEADDFGNVFVTDDLLSSPNIERYSREGQLLGHWGVLGSGDGEVSAGADVETDREGRVYVSSNGRLQRFSADGDFQRRWNDDFAEAVALSDSGRVYSTGQGDTVRMFSPAPPFSDVPPWVDESVGWLAWHDYVSGYQDGTFRAQNAITRAEKARMLYRIAGEPDVSELPDHGFTDVPVWVQDPVTWLKANGFMTGYDDGTFRAAEPITRGAEARVLYRIAGEPDVSELPDHGFTDVPDWVQDPVTWLKANGFMTGYDDDTFRPTVPITRGAEARVLYRVYG